MRSIQFSALREKKSKGPILFVFLLLFSQSAASDNCLDAGSHPRSSLAQKEKNSGKLMKSKPKIEQLYETDDLTQMPSVVLLNDEQGMYLIEIFCAIRGIIEGTRQLEVEEGRLFGAGKFYWPKDPTKPIKTEKSYPASNFRMTGIALGFRRASAESPWINAALFIHPANFPIGVYSMNMRRQLFNDFSLDKAVIEHRPHESVRNPVVFYFSHKKLRGVTLQVESRDDVVNVGDPYPSSFHGLEIIRDPNR
jgi:hypothetical protein